MSDGTEEKRAIGEHWDWAARGYQEDRGLDFESVDYAGYGAALESDLELLGDVSGARVAELGCGGAEIAIALAKRGARATGVDLSTEQLAIARERIAAEGVEVSLLRGDVEAVPLRADSQDVVVSVHVLQWVQDPPEFFREARRVLRDGGRIVVSTTHPFYDCLVEDDGLSVAYPYDQNVREGRGPNEGLTVTHLRIGDVVDALRDAGFTVTRIFEPGPGAREDESLAEKIPPVVVYVADA